MPVPAGRAWEWREGLRARAPAPYRSWEARSWALSEGRDQTPGCSAPPAAAAGKARPEATRGLGGSAQERSASLAPPGHRVGCTLPPLLRVAAPRPRTPLVSRWRGRACRWQMKRKPVPPLQEGTNGRAVSSSSQSELSGSGAEEMRCPTQVEAELDSGVGGISTSELGKRHQARTSSIMFSQASPKTQISISALIGKMCR